MKTRIQKMKQWCQDNPDNAAAIAVVTAVSTLAAVAIVMTVKEEKRQNSWIKEQESEGRRVLMLADSQLVAVNPDYRTY